MTEKTTAKESISQAIRDWMLKLQEYPGWREWKRSQIGYTLRFDDEFLPPEKIVGEFTFSPELDREHLVVISYMELLSTANALRDVEWYFRRYPFSRAPVTRESHLRYCCEMFFGRFYQFKERLKKLSKAVKCAAPNNGLDFGKFIKAFDKEFENEIRARHGIHHHETFDDVAISRIALLELTDSSDRNKFQRHAYQSHYRKTSKGWAARTRRRAEALDLFVEAVAAAVLKVCPFLDTKEA